MEGRPTFDRERSLAVLVLLALVALMGVGALALLLSGYTLI